MNMMGQFALLILSLMFVFPSVSAIQLVPSSCDQTWVSQVPNAPLDASFGFSSDGVHMAVGELENGPVRFGPQYPNGTNILIYITPQLPEILFAPLSPAPFGPWRIWMSSDGNVIVAALKEGGVQLFTGSSLLGQASAEYVWRFPGTQEFNNLAVSGDGRFVPALVQNRTSNTLYLLSSAYDNITWSYHFASSVGNATGIQPVGISYDGSRIATFLGGSIFVFSKSSNQTLWSKVVESTTLDSSVFMSQDGNDLVTIEDANVTVYSTSTGLVERSFLLDRDWRIGLGLNTPEQKFSLSKDGSTMAVIDGKLTVWDRASGAELFSKAVMDQIQVGTASPSTVFETPYTVSMSQNGTVIAVGSLQHAVFVFDRSGNELCHSYAGPNTAGNAAIVGISADGKHIGAFIQDFAELLTVTPQYYVLILIGISIPTMIVTGYLSVKRRKKNQKRPVKVHPRKDSPDRLPGPFVDPFKAANRQS